jgi:hypothetical protein
MAITQINKQMTSATAYSSPMKNTKTGNFSFLYETKADPSLCISKALKALIRQSIHCM